MPRKQKIKVVGFQGLYDYLKRANDNLFIFRMPRKESGDGEAVKLYSSKTKITRPKKGGKK